MKKFLGLSILLSSSVLAAPHSWVSGGAQGWIEYSIADSKGNTLVIACNEGYDDSTDHSVILNLKSGTEISGDNLLFMIDGKKKTVLSMPSFTREGGNEWFEFTFSLSKAKVVDVYFKSKKLATFKPTRQSVKSELGSGFCEAK